MKVGGTSGIGSTGGPKQARAADGGFSIPGLDQPTGPAQMARTAGMTGVANVDALLALQDVGGPLERRRRAVSRAGRILDVLDEVKLALLDGSLAPHDLDRLRRAVRDERMQTQDPGLEAVLEEIETRAAVELAKLERGGHAT
jgi:hypothetical protein